MGVGDVIRMPSMPKVGARDALKWRTGLKWRLVVYRKVKVGAGDVLRIKPT